MLRDLNSLLAIINAMPYGLLATVIATAVVIYVLKLLRDQTNSNSDLNKSLIETQTLHNRETEARIEERKSREERIQKLEEWQRESAKEKETTLELIRSLEKKNKDNEDMLASQKMTIGGYATELITLQNARTKEIAEKVATEKKIHELEQSLAEYKTLVEAAEKSSREYQALAEARLKQIEELQKQIVELLDVIRDSGVVFTNERESWERRLTEASDEIGKLKARIATLENNNTGTGPLVEKKAA